MIIIDVMKTGSDDGEGEKQNDNNMSDDGDVPEPVRLRCAVQMDARLHTGLLDYCANFLLPCGAVLWIIFLLLRY